jgi:LysM repeat protein
VQYPFASYPDGFHKSDYYISKLENLKNGLMPFYFDTVYLKQDGTVLFPQDLVKVSLEDYTITQDASQGSDITVSITLKQYNEYSTQVISFTNDSKTEATSTVRKASTKQIPKTYTVKKGDSLWKIAKLQLNDGSKWSYLAKKNSISSPYTIYAGQMLKL